MANNNEKNPNNEKDLKDVQTNEEIVETEIEETITEEEIIETKTINDEEVVSITDLHESEDVDELLATFDKDTSKLRKLSGIPKKVVTVLAIAMSLFHLYTAAMGTLLSMKQRSLHMIFAFALGFLLYPLSQKKSNKKRPSILDIIFLIMSVVVWGYIFFNVEKIALQGGKMTQMDMVLGFLAIFLTLEVTRRVVGPELPIVTIVFLAYAYLGPHMPGILAHRGFGIQRIVSHMYLTTEGIMGTPIGVSATFVFMFILFGSFLDKTGVGKFFIDFAFAVTGSTRSGPAMTSVLASGMMGSISGSSVANTVTTGAFTIPLMKKVGYKPYYAGAVEATASTGGQIMPPVMGAAAFIMADFTGFKYIEIVKAAIIPAVLYYLAVGTMVHLEACKLGIRGMNKDELPKFGPIFKSQGYLVIPLIIIITMLVMQKTPTLSAFIAIVSATVIAGIASIIKKDKSFTYKAVLDALESGAKGALGVACACACAGMIVGVVTLTGFGLRVAEIIVKVAQGKLLPTLALTMVASIILGMGLPTTAKYIVLATMAVPALTKLGVNLMAAHLFILYFGVVADVTPPVALAAYAGAGIAGANSMRTGVQAFKLAMGAFIIPYLFAMNPHLIMIDSTVGSTINWLPITSALPTILTALLGTVCLAGCIEGYLFDKTKTWERGLLLVAALTLLTPDLITDAIGIGVIVVLFVIQRNRVKKQGAKAA